MARRIHGLVILLVGTSLLFAAAACDTDRIASSAEETSLVQGVDQVPDPLVLPENAAGKLGGERTEQRWVGPLGGTISLGPIRLDVPAGALDHWVNIGVVVPAAGHVFALFGPSGLTFEEPVTLAVDLDQVRVIGDEMNLTWYWFNPSTLRWVDIGGTIDPEAHSLETQIRHFSLYRPGGRAGW